MYNFIVHFSYAISIDFWRRQYIAASAFRCNSGPLRCAKGKTGQGRRQRIHHHGTIRGEDHEDLKWSNRKRLEGKQFITSHWYLRRDITTLLCNYLRWYTILLCELFIFYSVIELFEVTYYSTMTLCCGLKPNSFYCQHLPDTSRPPCQKVRARLVKMGPNVTKWDFFKTRVDFRVPVNEEPSVHFCKGSKVWGRNVIGTNHSREGPKMLQGSILSATLNSEIIRIRRPWSLVQGRFVHPTHKCYGLGELSLGGRIPRAYILYVKNTKMASSLAHEKGT